jgi:dihydroorotase
MAELALRGGRVVDPVSGTDDVRDVIVTADRISAEETRRAEEIDCTGLVVAPGLVDLHSHLREPGFEHQETIETGTRAAALGGYTAVAAMANTDPVTDNAAVVTEIIALAARAGLCDVFPVGAITKGLQGETLAEMGEMVEAGVRMFSDDGNFVASARVLRNALTYVKAFPHEIVIADHCEEPSLVLEGQMNEGPTSYALGLAGRPAAAEDIAVARDLAVARLTGGLLHICHVSTAGAVELIREAKRKGIRVTAEATPHHLVLTDDELLAYDTNLKMHPPLRTAEDRDALRRGLADGTIDAIATDHAPHSVEEKDAEFDRSPPGTIGLETALGVVLTDLVAPGLIDLGRAIELLSTGPARILGAAGHGGQIMSGRPANLVVLDPEEPWVVEPPFASRARNSAFLGRELRGRVRYTVLHGELTVAEGKATR